VVQHVKPNRSGKQKINSNTQIRMKTIFTIPTTQKIKVIYVKGDTKYSATIPRPANNDELACVMLARKVGMSQVRYLQAFVPNVTAG